MNEKSVFKQSIELQLAAKEIGLDWLEISGILSKIHEETIEVEDAIQKKSSEHIKEELGDLLFTILCLIRHLDYSPEEILEQANMKFKKRYEMVLDILNERGKKFADADEMMDIWQTIKKQY